MKKRNRITMKKKGKRKNKFNYSNIQVDISTWE